MDEYISREETAKAFCEKCRGYYDGHCIHRGECDVDVIQTAPAADVQPVKPAHWYINPDGYYPQCSNCGYEPPREYEKQMKAFENNLMVTLSVKYDISCNKEELQKALKYDRDTYCKGFKAGYEKRKSDYMAHWVIASDGHYPYCSECGARPREMTKYCAECGRRMI